MLKARCQSFTSFQVLLRFFRYLDAMHFEVMEEVCSPLNQTVSMVHQCSTHIYKEHTAKAKGMVNTF